MITGCINRVLIKKERRYSKKTNHTLRIILNHCTVVQNLTFQMLVLYQSNMKRYGKINQERSI